MMGMNGQDHGLWVAKNFGAFVEKLPPAEQAAALTLAGPIVRNLTFSLLVAEQFNLTGRLNFKNPLCKLVEALATELRPIDVKEPNETVRSALLATEAIASILDALMATSGPRQADAMLIGFRLGRADVRTVQVSSGLWDVMADAEVNYQAARKQAEARKAGGTKRGAQSAAAAQIWKTEALALAVELDRKKSNRSRDQLATEILFGLLSESPGHKAVEVWLKDEAEAPNGPIRSRARRKPA